MVCAAPVGGPDTAPVHEPDDKPVANAFEEPDYAERVAVGCHDVADGISECVANLVAQHCTKHEPVQESDITFVLAQRQSVVVAVVAVFRSERVAQRFAKRESVRVAFIAQRRTDAKTLEKSECNAECEPECNSVVDTALAEALRFQHGGVDIVLDARGRAGGVRIKRGVLRRVRRLVRQQRQLLPVPGVLDVGVQQQRQLRVRESWHPAARAAARPRPAPPRLRC